MAVAFLIAAVVGLLYVLNALRPLRLQLLVVPAFFSAWLTVELAPQLLVITVVGAGIFVARGALETWEGWAALGISALNAVLLWKMVRDAYRVHDVLDEALTDAIGPAAAHRPVVWREFAFPFKLWSRQIVRRRNIPYIPGGRRRRQLDVWHDREEREGRPCFLYVPGGAWTVGVSNKNHQGKPLLMEMVARGWVCFSMNYPVSPRATFPDHAIAVKQAIAWIRENAHTYGGDAGFILISGNSAGGHLSSLAALTPNDAALQPGFEDKDTTIQAAAPIYGVYDFSGAMLDELPRAQRRHKRGMIRMLEYSVLKKKRTKAKDVFESASPWHRVGPHAPPFFVVHGTHDTLALVEEARAFIQRLRDTSHEKVIYAELPGAQHAFDHFLSIRALYTVRAIARFGDWAYERWSSDAGRRDRCSTPAAAGPTSPS
jgi:acetyl esterase/lipase